MTQTICISNQKGGVGKTTTAINLAACLAMAGNATLLVDMDPQCNATSGLGLRPVENHPLLSHESIRTSVVETELDGLFLLPGSRRFRDVDQLANADSMQSQHVVEHLTHGTGIFDYVIIDSPPSLGRLTQTALSASDEVLMPIQCEYFAMEGLTQMIEVIREIMQRGDRRLSFGGILLTMYDPSLELTQEVDDQVREFFGEIVFETTIPRDVQVSEAPSHGRSVIDYAPRSRGTRAYIELCMEILNRE
ncbi:MAG: ParA family protein [Pirellulaceae bacterium]